MSPKADFISNGGKHKVLNRILCIYPYKNVLYSTRSATAIETVAIFYSGSQVSGYSTDLNITLNL